MSTIALSGNDTVTINGTVLTGLATGDCVTIKFPNEVANVKTGKNGNSIFGLNETGRQCEVEVRVIRGSSDDRMLANLLVQQRSNFAGFTLMQAQFIKRLGDGKGNVASDMYLAAGGIFSNQPEAKTNVEGDAAQSEILYKMKFANAARVIT